MPPSSPSIPRSPDASSRSRPIVVIGSINTDFVHRVPRLPGPGETVTAAGFDVLPGGKGANQAVAAARLGARVSMVGRVGFDLGFGVLDRFEREGIDTRHVRRTSGVPTGQAQIFVDPNGENCIVVSPGANAHVSAADVDAAAPLLRSAAVVLLQLEIPLVTVRHALSLCRRLGVPTVLDPAPVPPKGPPRALFAADYLTPNQPEALQLTGRQHSRGVRLSDPKPVATALHSRGANTVILKLGARGAAIAAGDGRFQIVRPFRVRVTDSTAAGDAFNAAFAVALADGMSLKDAVRFANAAGALCCTKQGAQPALPTRSAVERLLRAFSPSLGGRHHKVIDA